MGNKNKTQFLGNKLLYSRSQGRVKCMHSHYNTFLTHVFYIQVIKFKIYIKNTIFKAKPHSWLPCYFMPTHIAMCFLTFECFYYLFTWFSGGLWVKMHLVHLVLGSLWMTHSTLLCIFLFQWYPMEVQRFKNVLLFLQVANSSNLEVHFTLLCVFFSFARSNGCLKA